MATNSNNIVLLIQTHVTLKPSRRVLRGNCPFHPDDALSLMVSPDKNTYKCFGCGMEGGPVEFQNALKSIRRN